MVKERLKNNLLMLGAVFLLSTGTGLLPVLANGERTQPTQTESITQEERAAPTQPAAAGPLVTLRVTREPVVNAIDMLLAGTGYRYNIRPGVSGLISFSFANMPLSQALNEVAEAANLSYAVSGDTIVFFPARATQPEPVVTPQEGPTGSEAAPVEEYPAENPSPGGITNNVVVGPIVNNPPVVHPGSGYGFNYGFYPYYPYYPDYVPPSRYISPSMQRFFETGEYIRRYHRPSTHIIPFPRIYHGFGYPIY